MENKLPGALLLIQALAILCTHYTVTAYECSIEEGTEPNWEDYSCESYWTCSDFQGVLSKCEGSDQFHFPKMECLPNSEVWCQWQHHQASEWWEQEEGSSDGPDTKKDEVVHVYHDPAFDDTDLHLKLNHFNGRVSPPGMTNTHKHSHEDGLTHSQSHTHEDGLTHSHPHTHENGLTHSHPHTHEDGLTHSHPHTHEDGLTHSHPHTHEDELTHSNPHTHEDGLTHSHPHTHENGLTHSHPHTHEDGLTHFHPHTYEDGLTHSHPHTHEDGLTHSHPHTHEDGLTHSHPHTHEDELTHSHPHTHEDELTHSHPISFDSSDSHSHGQSRSNVPSHSVPHSHNSDYRINKEASTARKMEEIDRSYANDLYTHYSADHSDVSSRPQYVCATEYGHEPDLHDRLCKSFWRCDEYEGTKIVCGPGLLYDYSVKACRHYSHVDCHAQLQAYFTSGSRHRTEVEQSEDGVTVIHHYHHHGDGHLHSDQEVKDYDYGSLREEPRKFKVYQHQNISSIVQPHSSLPHSTPAAAVVDTRPGLPGSMPGEVASPFEALTSLIRSTRLRNIQDAEHTKHAVPRHDVSPLPQAHPSVLDNDITVSSTLPADLN